MVKDSLRTLLTGAVERAHRSGALKSAEAVIEIETPRQAGHGDLASNLAMTLTRSEHRAPRDIAADILAHLEDPEGLIAKTEVAGPGFINFTFSRAVWQAVAPRVLTAGPDYGRSAIGAGRKVQVEFVSANPTGPLHVGHGRGAAVGDAVAGLLAAVGYDVQREYYINDAGRQMLILGGSVFYRYLQALGRPAEQPEEMYRGDYIADLAARAVAEHGDSLADLDPAQGAKALYPQAAAAILDSIREDLAGFGVEFNEWFSEKSLHDSGRLAEILDGLKAGDVAYEKDGAWWYRTEQRGDEKDRVLVKSSGDLTYFAADVAYHADKFNRGFEWIIDVWGADHHGYIPRMKAMVQGLGKDKDQLTLKLVQLVNLLRGGEPVQMSTRAGEFVTLREVVDEVGRDPCRFIFLTRRSDSHLDFDLELAKQKSMDNPVYYVQYAHARVASIGRKARQEAELDFPTADGFDPALLTDEAELTLLRQMAAFPEMVAGAAQALEPHRVTYYLTELASAFHSYYNRSRVIVDDRQLSLARLGLVKAVQTVIAAGLGLLGVDAPQRMDREE